MSISLSNESKSKVSLSNEAKGAEMTWDNSDPMTWDEATFPWDSPRIQLSKESKSKVSLSKEDKL